MVPYSFTPDWLLSPPPISPYLIKQEKISQFTKLDDLVFKIYYLTSNEDRKDYNKYINYIKHDHYNNVLKANEHIKLIRENIVNDKTSSKSIIHENKNLKRL